MTVYIFDTQTPEDSINGKLDTYHALLTDAGAEITAVDHWGRRQLTYPIRKQPAGYYVVAQFKSGVEPLPEYERRLKLDEELLRYMVVLHEGVGALASAATAGPYVQIGRMRPDGTGWYTTQLVVYAIEDDFGPGMLYLPTVALRPNGPDKGTAANFSAGLGLAFQPDRGTETNLMLGMTVEFGRGRN